MGVSAAICGGSASAATSKSFWLLICAVIRQIEAWADGPRRTVGPRRQKLAIVFRPSTNAFPCWLVPPGVMIY
jgi:hypothetical protein